jgi:hypothetical protein
VLERKDIPITRYGIAAGFISIALQASAGDRV